jgi:hypothetical protein
MKSSVQVSGVWTLAPNMFSQHLGGSKRVAKANLGDIYKSHHEIEPLATFSKFLCGHRTCGVTPDNLSDDPNSQIPKARFN